MSNHDTYVIRATQKGWALLLNGQTIETFDSWAEAERAGMTGLDISRQNRTAAELFYQESAGEPRLLARSGADLVRNQMLGPDPADRP